MRREEGVREREQRGFRGRRQLQHLMETYKSVLHMDEDKLFVDYSAERI